MDGVGVEVRQCDGTGDLGENGGKLFVRSSSQMVGYLDEHGRITNPVSDGWFETGDLARIDDDGTIHLRGRDSEVVNVSGLKVVPCEVEEAITLLPGVVEVKVYAGEHRSGTQIVKAAVAVENGLSEADIRAHCEQHLVYYKRPQVVTLVDALPRTPTGKIIRDQLP
jgi:acyl-coenzyme A synthetase/AMP-(fatty) acid ligase